jgi:hypothetical protein
VDLFKCDYAGHTGAAIYPAATPSATAAVVTASGSQTWRYCSYTCLQQAAAGAFASPAWVESLRSVTISAPTTLPIPQASGAVA